MPRETITDQCRFIGIQSDGPGRAFFDPRTLLLPPQEAITQVKRDPGVTSATLQPDGRVLVICTYDPPAIQRILLYALWSYRDRDE